jgi:hypothetical protein
LPASSPAPRSPHRVHFLFVFALTFERFNHCKVNDSEKERAKGAILCV